MKYYKRLQVYKNSTGTLTYDPLIKEARSYNWYVIARKIGPYMVLNNYCYSRTTIKHFYKIRKQISDTFTQIHFEIEAPRGLQDLDAAESLLKKRIQDLKDKINRKGSHKKTNANRIQMISYWEAKLAEVNYIIDAERREAFEAQFTEQLEEILEHE